MPNHDRLAPSPPHSLARQHASHEGRLPGACDGESSAASTGVPGVARAARFVN